MNQNNKENEQWKLLVSNLKEKAIAKFGNGWQTVLSQITGIKQQNISRLFGLKYSPNLRNYCILMSAIDLKNENYVDDLDISKFLVSIDKNNNEMYVLHREDPCYLVHIKQEIPMRFILVESYDADFQDESLLLHSSMIELKDYIVKLFSDKENFDLN